MKRIAAAVAGLALALMAILGPTPAAAALASFTATTTTVAGGKSTYATITLSAPAGSTGQTVALTSSNSLATVPKSITVAAGKGSALVTITTKAVSTISAVTITASRSGVTKSIRLTLTPATLSVFSVPKTVVGGTKNSGTVMLDGLAPSGGLVVRLSRSGGVATVPSSVTIPAGKGFASFPIASTPVTANTSTAITAKSGTVTKSGVVTVTPPAVSLVMLSPKTLFAGGKAAGTVYLSGPAPGTGVRVRLSTDLTAPPLTVPSSVTVPAGATSATFSLTATAVSAATTVSVRATYGITRSTTVVVGPPSVATITMATTTVAPKSGTTGTITLTGPALAGGLIVRLSASPALMTLPASVTVPAGATSVTFAATSGAPVTATMVKLTASGGVTTATASITVTGTAPLVKSIAIQPNPIGGQSPFDATITLTGPAPAGGTTVTVASQTPSLVTIGGTFTVPAGASQLTVTGTTGAVTSVTAVRISATTSGTTLNAYLTLRPYVVGAVGVLTPTVTGGTVLDGAVVLTGLAPEGGAAVTLFSSNPAVASVPAALMVPAGQFGTHFYVTIAPVTAPVTVKLTAIGGGSTVTTTLVVEPLRLVAVAPIDYASYYGARIDLNGPALAAGFPMTVTSSDPSLVTVPATVVVPAGSAYAFFPAVNQTAEPQTVTLTVTAVGVSVSTEATIKPARLGGVSVAQTRAPGGNTITGTVSLYSFAPPGGITVALSSSDPSALEVPVSVTVPAGADRVEFPVVLHTVDDTRRATITATQGTVTSTVAVTVTELRVSQLTLSQSAVVGGSTLEATVTLTGIVEGTPCSVRIFPLYVDYIAAPEWVVIPVGARSATFTVQTTAVAVPQNVLVRVGLNSVVEDAPLTLLPDPATPTATPEPTMTPTPGDAVLVGSTSTATPVTTETGTAALPEASPMP